MKVLLELPHRVCESTCYVNGIEDILEWKGQKYMDYLLSVLGGMGGFAYLKFKSAQPPCMVYWGANPKHLVNDLAEIIGFHPIVVENKTFWHTLTKIEEFLQQGHPVIAGALDMFYLHYYPQIFQQEHIPIHYILVVGFDDEKGEVYIQDCGFSGVQAILAADFEKALNVNVPGMSRKNTARILVLGDQLPTELEAASRGFQLRAQKMLHPPVSMLGIPAMRKLAKEILQWHNRACFEHLVTYATIPPHIPKNFKNSHGMRIWMTDVLVKLGNKYDKPQWTEAAQLFSDSGTAIMGLCERALQEDKESISKIISQIADIEEAAYQLLIQSP